MERFAHVAALNSIGGGHETALLAPSNAAFNAELVRRNLGSYNPSLRLFIFPSRRYPEIQHLLPMYYGADVCQICFSGNTPCWFWRTHSSFHWCDTFFVTTPMALPETPEEEARIIRDMRPPPAIINQLTASSANLRSAIESNRPITPPAPRRSQRQPAPATQVVPGVRCNACGQVIPPGFDKAHDSRKTEDEIYNDCVHDFDAATKICKKCKLACRDTSRTSLLEVD